MRECRPAQEAPRSWGGFLNDGATLDEALGAQLAGDVTALAKLLAPDERQLDDWIRGCSVRREPNLRMLPCVRCDVDAHGKVTGAEFFMVRSLARQPPHILCVVQLGLFFSSQVD